ncbi:MAG: hypothetical protein KAT91_03205 [Candidatus Aenigmarchaeota archaeon]|nr:hypothetical protein [Candidatus Aenigmarchaeota archaeon]
MKLKRFCPKCGVEAEELINGLCRDCAEKIKPTIDAPAKITVLVCECGRAAEKNKWIKYENITQLINSIVIENIKMPKKTKINVDFELPKEFGATTIPVSAALKDMPQHTKTIEFVLKNTTCPACSRIHGGYYEAVIQIRAKESLKDIYEFLKKEIDSGSKKDKLSFIVKEGIIKNGKDLYVGSFKSAKKAAKKAETIYKLSRKTSYADFGMKDGKKLTRATILLKE